ncbi:glycerol-3-phosphate 1-O-acyltransferase PlsY [Haliovirga abyssi]|uniref:Glycerol-3-phosphate acyltransferase n=1 Tax=Haliovirga abyssi TaxID=2996794 RepID=A0AAU9DGR9_9FUSO|nr:glycerol-3-phosphate 1-O-acyltransferase PlsY [Haliovirga abyssi]BDU50647.1 glycerol-3-phosphate acyltransferase [Haliovirga abyssi]
MIKLVMGIVLSYFIGAIPSGVIIGKKFKNIDIREHGSKNSGATNAYRVLGAKLGIIVFIFDVLKGIIPILIGMSFKIAPHNLVYLGVAAIIGHTFSPYLKFKGGKGVATSLGVFLILVPKTILFVFGVFAIIVYFSKYISLGSITAAFLFPFANYFFYKNNKIEVTILGALVAAYIIYKHKSNIGRLLKGEENKFNFKKK